MEAELDDNHLEGLRQLLQGPGVSAPELGERNQSFLTEFGDTRTAIEWGTGGGNPWIDYRNDSGRGVGEGPRVRPDYFREHATDHLIALAAWSPDTGAVEIGGVSLVVPLDIWALIGLEDGLWVLLQVWVGGGGVAISEIRFLMGDYSDISIPESLPIQSWKREILLKANELLLTGASPPTGYRRVHQVQPRSDSPTGEVLQRVVELRDNFGRSFEQIGHEVDRSSRTVRRYYKRAKGDAT